MAERTCMICGQPCGFRGFGRLCEEHWGGPLHVPEGAMSLSVASQIVVPAEGGHRQITVAHAAVQDSRVTRYRPDGSVELVKHPGRRTILPSSMGGQAFGGTMGGR